MGDPLTADKLGRSKTRYTFDQNFKPAQFDGDVDSIYGDETFVPKAILQLYWTSQWANLHPSLRAKYSLNFFKDAQSDYIQPFTGYAEYDFLNDQAMLLMEDLFWESNYSFYTYYDRVSLGANCSGAKPKIEEVSDMIKFISPYEYGVAYKSDRSKLRTSLSSTLTPLTSDNFYTQPKWINNNYLSLLPILAGLKEAEHSYLGVKNVYSLLGSANLALRPISNNQVLSSDSVKVFNNLTADFEEFGYLTAADKGYDFDTSIFDSVDVPTALKSIDEVVNEVESKDQEFLTSNTSTSATTKAPLLIRPSVKDAIVTAKAYQKVFRSKFDENRSHINIGHYGTLAQEQPFINDGNVPYKKILGKDRTSFYKTPFFNKQLTSSLTTFGSLYNQNIRQMFEFPFLDADESDVIRAIWVDWYSRFTKYEVQPASISKFSTLGVQYNRKPYDFSSNQGDYMAAVHGYYVRASRARKNYLPNWTTSPVIYDRANALHNIDPFYVIFEREHRGTKTILQTLKSLRWISELPLFNFNHTPHLSASVSGNSIFHKSTWRPQSGLAAYHHNTTKAVEILSKREQIIREFARSQNATINLPMRFSASPKNPLLRRLMSSFDFHNPLTISSEYSRDYFITSTHFFNFARLKALTNYLIEQDQFLPWNPALVNDTFFSIF